MVEKKKFQRQIETHLSNKENKSIELDGFLIHDYQNPVTKRDVMKELERISISHNIPELKEERDIKKIMRLLNQNAIYISSIMLPFVI